MQNPPNGSAVPIIGAAKKSMPIEPFHIDEIGWFKPDETITAEHVAHVTIILITLMLPRAPHISFKLKEYAEQHDLLKYFTDEKPGTVKALEEENAKVAQEMKSVN